MPLALQRELADSCIRLTPEEDQFSINYSLVAELLDAEEDDLQDHLAELAELVPDFPIDESEFDDFWNGFRMIASQLPLSDEPPQESRGSRSVSPSADATQGVTADGPSEAVSSPESGDVQLDPTDETGRPLLRIVDFFTPRIPKQGTFHLLPATAVILGRRAGHALSALRELDAMTELPLQQTAFGCVFDPDSTRPAESRCVQDVILEDAAPLPLTTSQAAIVRSARTAPLTVVTGPPGTGKSYTITAIVLDALLRGQSVLVASQMDKAVQVVADNVERIAGRFAVARSGQRAAQRELANKISKLTGPRQPFTSTAGAAAKPSRAAFRKLTQRLELLERRYEEILGQELSWSACRQSWDRLQPISPLPVHEVTGRSVRKATLLARRARQALDGSPGWLLRKWGRWHSSRAARLLQVPSDWEYSLDELDELLEVQQLRSRMNEVESTLRADFPADLVWQEIADLEQRRDECALQLLKQARQKRLHKLVSRQQHRKQLRDFATLLRRRRHDLKRKLRENIEPELLLTAFPAWACTHRTLGEILPATPAMFDLTVIDESSQCDPALASVALLRGRRAVVVGDPHQLRHVCFLSRAREQAAFVRCGFNDEMKERFRYRRSLFDIAADAVDQNHFFMLDQHFRSHPQIIDYSNRAFYDGQLRVMTRRPSRRPESAIHVVQTSGRRAAESSVNPGEIDAVMEILTGLVNSTQPGQSPASIGIVSPFRDHVDAIRDRIIRQLTATIIQRHGIVVGTAHSFQGDEKDIVILTTSVTAESHRASLRFLENPNLFNVAVTRARKQQYVVTSVGVDELPPGLLRDYLHHAAEPWQSHCATGKAMSDFENQLVQQLEKQQIATWPGFEAAGVRIHVVASHGDRHVAILCDGPETAIDPALDALTTHRLLFRAGWQVRRIPHRTWHDDWFACCDMVRHVLDH